jgi:hypothetical protein
MKGAIGAWVSGVIVFAAVPLLLGVLFIAPFIAVFVVLYLLMSGKEST